MGLHMRPDRAGSPHSAASSYALGMPHLCPNGSVHEFWKWLGPFRMDGEEGDVLHGKPWGSTLAVSNVCSEMRNCLRELGSRHVRVAGFEGGLGSYSIASCVILATRSPRRAASRKSLKPMPTVTPPSAYRLRSTTTRSRPLCSHGVRVSLSDRRATSGYPTAGSNLCSFRAVAPGAVWRGIPEVVPRLSKPRDDGLALQAASRSGMPWTTESAPPVGDAARVPSP